MDHLVESLFHWEGGGEGYSRKVYTGRLRPEVQPLTLFAYHLIITDKVPLSHT